MVTTLPAPSRSKPPRARKAPETVTTDATWCCVPVSPPSPRLKLKDLHKIDQSILAKHLYNQENLPLPFEENELIADSRVDNRKAVDRERKSGEHARAEEVLKTGEIDHLIKQGFINGSNVEKTGSGSPFKLRLSPGRVSPMVESAKLNGIGGNFNSPLTTGLPQPASPPIHRSRGSPTLFEMMNHEQQLQSKALVLQRYQVQEITFSSSTQDTSLIASSPRNQFNDATSSDVQLMLKNKGGLNVTLNVHKHILASQSRFFAAKLSERWSNQQRSLPYLVEISDCDDVELYADTLRLMYCGDVKRKLLKESVSRVLGILKVSAAIVFEIGVVSCLEYLEAVPWPEEEEEKVMLALSELKLDSIGAGEVLKRLSPEDPNASEDVLVRLLHSVTRGTDEKARREMKNLVTRMLRENAAKAKDPIDVSKESLYRSCQVCLDSLVHLFTKASSSDFVNRTTEDRGSLVAQMARQADNLLWLLEILIDREIAEEFVTIWACQIELATLHVQIPTMFRYEISRLTARLCIALGKGQVVVPKDVRLKLLQIWLEPLINDFPWMQRACKGLDRKVIEEGLSKTILTLPLKQQQHIMMSWFERFLKNGDDCPNLQMAFEVWWRRTFLRHCNEDPPTSSVPFL